MAEGAPAPLISVVVANWNGMRFLEKCLASVYGQGYPSFEVILVDNGSTDGSAGFVKRNFPKARVVENRENTGFAAGNNRGMEIAGGRFILTLNNDTELEGDFLENLMKTAGASDKKTGMWAPKILSSEDRGVVDSAGGLLIYPDCLAKGRGRLEKDAGQYDGLKEVFVPSACSALYRKELLDDVGLFDEDFFAYCEDTDLGLRARLRGWKAQYVPSAIVYHYYSGTGGRYTPLKAYLVERNHFWVALKNLPPGYLLRLPFYTLLRYAVQVWGLIAGRGAAARFTGESSAWWLLPVLLRAYLDALKKLPAMLLKRKEIQKRRAVTSREVGEWLKRYRLGVTDLVLKD
ncbi:MAG: glycosyltransferase family 2 protein [Deltaproteobacteria bacterium]|nr:glycosyltransferase family 2 protein [Deltaproteobacteria bacterium]